MDEAELNAIETNEVESRWFENGNPVLGVYGVGPASEEDVKKDCGCQGGIWMPAIGEKAAACLPGKFKSNKQWDIQQKKCVTEAQRTKLDVEKSAKKGATPSASVWGTYKVPIIVGGVLSLLALGVIARGR